MCKIVFYFVSVKRFILPQNRFFIKKTLLSKNIDLLQLANEKVYIRELNKCHIWLYQNFYFKNHSLILKVLLQNSQKTKKTKNFSDYVSDPLMSRCHGSLNWG